MPMIKSDLSLCQGYANCVVAADNVFDIDDDGLVMILKQEIDESDVPRVDAAARSCPVSAVWLES